MVKIGPPGQDLTGSIVSIFDNRVSGSQSHLVMLVKIDSPSQLGEDRIKYRTGSPDHLCPGQTGSPFQLWF